MTISTKRHMPSVRFCRNIARLAVLTTTAALLLTAPAARAASRSADPFPEQPRQHVTHPAKDLMKMSQNNTPPGAAEMAAAKTVTMKVLAIGTWTAKATPETRPSIMPAEARDTMRPMLAGKIDQWFAKNDGSGAVFLMNVTDPGKHTSSWKICRWAGPT
jgi:hypothetical protein